MKPGGLSGSTLLAGVDHGMAAAREEIFGPVLSVITYDSIEETMRLIPQIEAGTVWVNTHVPLDPNLPFGGYKQSGIGREFGRGAVEAFTELKSVCIAY